MPLTLILLLSFGLKLAFPQPPTGDVDQETTLQMRHLRDFLDAKYAQPTPAKFWHLIPGWEIRTKSCTANVAITSLNTSDADDVYRDAAGHDGVYRFIFDGKISATQPVIAYRLSQIQRFLFWPFAPRRWRRPLEVVMIMAAKCQAAESLPWAELWRRPWSD